MYGFYVDITFVGYTFVMLLSSVVEFMLRIDK